MSLKVTQTCAKCGRSRELDIRPVVDFLDNPDDARQLSGWRVINGKDICAEDIAEFLKDAVN